MSELIQKNDNRATIRWKLMASVSMAALIASGLAANEALAADSDSSRPQIWIELGAQLERASGGNSPFIPDFYSNIDPAFASPAKVVSELPWALGQEAKVSFQPENSDWIFSAGIRYGRAHDGRSIHQQTQPAPFLNVYPFITFFYTAGPKHKKKSHFVCCHTAQSTHSRGEFADVQSSNQESHDILDFQAGKDVGVGLLGRQSNSVVSLGVRFAQFHTKSNGSVRALTDLQHYNYYNSAWEITQYPQKYRQVSRFRTYSLNAGSERNFKGIGPSISWDASATLAGNPDSSELTFDWGINAALLFGKQKAKTHHQTSAHYFKPGTANVAYPVLYYKPQVHYTRSRSVTVPNIGGMAGFSIKFPNAKISIGYRADYFFGAMDSGWDTRKSADRSFMGPFASISVGLGD